MGIAVVACNSAAEVMENARAVNARILAGRIPPKATINIEAIMGDLAAMKAERDYFEALAAQYQADNISLSTKLGMVRALDEPKGPAPITVERIIKVTCKYYDMKRVDLISVRRDREHVRPRQVAMYLCKEMTPSSLPSIGRMFGNRDHTTVLHAHRQITALRAENAEIERAVKTIAAALVPVVHMAG